MSLFNRFRVEIKDGSESPFRKKCEYNINASAIFDGKQQ